MKRRNLLLLLLVITEVISVFIVYQANKPVSSEEWVAQAEEHLSRKNNELVAVYCYTQAIRLDPEFITAYTGRAHAYYELGLYNKALRDISTAIEIEPEFSLLYGERGVPTELRNLLRGDYRNGRNKQ